MGRMGNSLKCNMCVSSIVGNHSTLFRYTYIMQHSNVMRSNVRGDNRRFALVILEKTEKTATLVF